MDIQDIMNACGRIKADNRQGTGYLIAPDRIVTCCHVVDGALSIEVYFTREDPLTSNLSEFSRTATVIEPVDENCDCAVLKLNENVADTNPLQLAESCEWKASWDSFGYPSAAKTAGITAMGIVSNHKAHDDRKIPVLELTSPDVAAGMATPIHGFSGSPVIVDGYVIGHLKRFVPDPEEPNRPAFGKVWATRSSCIRNVLSNLPGIVQAQVATEIELPLPGSPEALNQINRINTLVNNWFKPESGLSRETAINVAAESLVQLGAPLKALNLLGDKPASIRGKQLRALALAKTNLDDNLLESVRILEDLKKLGQFDSETGGILAGRYKQMWQKTGDIKLLPNAFDLYDETYRVTGDPYPGINAAATALWLNKKDESQSLAKDVLNKLNIDKDEMDHWQMASKGEAYLLAKDMSEAMEWYGLAAKRCDFAKESIETMRRQAQRHINALDIKDIKLDELIPPE